jgi:general secretion pathway protein D
MTSLGVQLATNASAFGTLEENAFNVLNELINIGTFGSLTLTSTANINVLVDLLMKNANARILNQPTLWTKDNEEAVFVKGQNVAFIVGDQTDRTNPQAVTQQFDYRDVGVTLRVRPNITPEKAVDVTINLIISQVSDEDINGQLATNKLDTTTHLIVDDGETILLGGILFQKDSQIRRKVPLLGDLPIIGALFSHEEKIQRNSELLAFITPYVIDGQTSEEAAQQAEEPVEKMEAIIAEFEKIFGADVLQETTQ